MKNAISQLEPTIVWSYFDQITRVPRPSKKEELIREFLRNFAKENTLELIEDHKGNIIIRRPATKGYTTQEAVILQTHMDMVCEKDSTSTHDFMRDPIDTYIQDGWVKAHGTTLGADCGIGMAMAMAALTDTSLKTPPLEALFTVDEEQGLTGAMELQEGILKGTRMINLDSEDDGEIFIGCAGGVDTIGKLEYKAKKAPTEGYTYLRISVSGLMGGHSGDDIEKGYANAIKLTNRLVYQALQNPNVRLAQIQGGNLRNAIPREAWAIIGVPNNQTKDLTQQLDNLTHNICQQYKHTEPRIEILIQECAAAQKVLGPIKAQILVATLSALPHGPQAMSHTMEDLVETSTNLASIKFLDNSTIEIVTSQRSSIEIARDEIAITVSNVLRLAGAQVIHTDPYPGWAPNPSSKFVKQAAILYQKLFAQKAKVKAIHAGLECGLILTKYPELDIISIGPTLRGVHSPSERIEIQTVERQWIYLKALLEQK